MTLKHLKDVFASKHNDARTFYSTEFHWAWNDHLLTIQCKDKTTQYVYPLANVSKITETVEETVDL